LGFPAIVFYGPTKVTPIGFNVNGTSCKYEDGYVGSNGLAIYNAVFMLTSVSGIITICVLYAMVVKKIFICLPNGRHTNKYRCIAIVNKTKADVNAVT
jgi:hypothetical protein